ncbi:MAG: hypothetical protein SFW62_10085 [Alphaproteobacteria bacterium]|nr:hypothetical protein [Alphaproteobacteria bacterium]
MPPIALHRSRFCSITLSRRQRPVSFDDLATILELDLLMGDKKGFHRHLAIALEDAWRQGNNYR